MVDGKKPNGWWFMLDGKKPNGWWLISDYLKGSSCNSQFSRKSRTMIMGFPLLEARPVGWWHQWHTVAKHQVEGSKFGSLSIWHGTCHKDPSKVDLRQSDITLDQASLGHFSWVQCSGSLPNPSLIVNQENSVSGFWIIWHAKSSTSGGFFSEWFEYIWPTSTQLQHNQKDGDKKLIMIIIITC